MIWLMPTVCTVSIGSFTCGWVRNSSTTRTWLQFTHSCSIDLSVYIVAAHRQKFASKCLRPTLQSRAMHNSATTHCCSKNKSDNNILQWGHLLRPSSKPATPVKRLTHFNVLEACGWLERSHIIMTTTIIIITKSFEPNNDD